MLVTQTQNNAYTERINPKKIDWMKSCIHDEIPIILFNSTVVIFDYSGVDESWVKFSGVQLLPATSKNISFLVHRREGLVQPL